MPQAVALAVVDALALAEGSAEAIAVTLAVETVVTVGISVGLSIVEQAILGSPEQPKPPHGRRENIRQATPPRVKYYGRVRAGGPFKMSSSA